MSQEEQEAQATRKEAQLSAPARAEVEKIMQATIREYEAIRRMHGGLPFTVEEKQATLKELKRHVYGQGESRQIQGGESNDKTNE